jgi:hypothetical protein
MTEFLRYVEERGGPPVPDYSPDSYWQLHEWSVNNPERFWSLIWRFCGIVGHRGTGGGAERVGVGLDHMGPPDEEKGPRWFPDASLNFAENLLRFTDDEPAIASWNEEGHQRTLTFKELREAVETLALALSRGTATPYGSNQSDSDGAAVRPSLDGIVQLLPTPRSQNGEDRNNLIWPRPLDEPQNLENALARLPGELTSQPFGGGSG